MSQIAKAAGRVDVRLLHPAPQRRLRQIQLTRDRADGPVAGPHQAHGLRLELGRELPSIPFLRPHDTLLPHSRAYRGVNETEAGSPWFNETASVVLSQLAAPCPSLPGRRSGTVGAFRDHHLGTFRRISPEALEDIRVIRA